MEYPDEQVLIRSVLDGDTQAFAVLLHRYQRPVHALVRRIVPNREDAEELTQDVFVKAFGKLDAFRGGSRFSTWLYRIAWNTAVSATRKHKLSCPDVDDALLANLPDQDVDEALARDDDEARLQRLERAIEALQPIEKALISLYYQEDRSVADLAGILDLSPENVKVKLHRTRKKLVYLLNKDNDEER